MNSVARHAMAYGLKRGHVVALSTDKPLLHVAVILGLLKWEIFRYRSGCTSRRPD